MAHLAGESLLAVELLEIYRPTDNGSYGTPQDLAQPRQQHSPVAKEEQAEEGVSCDAELFVLLLQRYTEPTRIPATLSKPKSSTMKLEHWRHVHKYKSGLVLEALATQRSAALCGKASLPVLLPMLDALLRQPTDTLAAAAAGIGGADGVSPGACMHDQSEVSGIYAGSSFLSGESAEEQARARITAAEDVRDAIDTLQLVLGASGYSCACCVSWAL